LIFLKSFYNNKYLTNNITTQESYYTYGIVDKDLLNNSSNHSLSLNLKTINKFNNINNFSKLFNFNIENNLNIAKQQR
jgi:protoheme ferro-lyase